MFPLILLNIINTSQNYYKTILILPKIPHYTPVNFKNDMANEKVSLFRFFYNAKNSILYFYITKKCYELNKECLKSIEYADLIYKWISEDFSVYMSNFENIFANHFEQEIARKAVDCLIDLILKYFKLETLLKNIASHESEEENQPLQKFENHFILDTYFLGIPHYVFRNLSPEWKTNRKYKKILCIIIYKMYLDSIFFASNQKGNEPAHLKSHQIHFNAPVKIINSDNFFNEIIEIIKERDPVTNKIRTQKCAYNIFLDFSYYMAWFYCVKIDSKNNSSSLDILENFTVENFMKYLLIEDKIFSECKKFIKLTGKFVKCHFF